MLFLILFGLFCSIDSFYYYYHKGKKDNLSIKIIFFILDIYNIILKSIRGLKKRYAKEN